MPFSHPPDNPEPLITLAKGLSGIVSAALIGRLTWHVAEVQRGRRRFWSLALLWEALTVPSVVLIGMAVSEYLRLAPGSWQQLGLIAALAWFGPRGLTALFVTWFTRRQVPAQKEGSQP